MIIASVLKQKGADIVAVAPGTSIAELCRVLAEHRIGACPVMEAGRVQGMISERDVVRALTRHGASTLDMQVADLMTRLVRSCSPQATIAEVMEMMTAARVRHVPVMEGDKVLGLVSIGDVVKARIDETEHEVDSLKAYVAGAA